MDRRLVVGCAVAIVGLAGSVTAAESKAGEAFTRLSHRFVRELLALSPVTASEAGYHKHTDESGKTIELDARIDELGPEAYERLGRFYREWKERLDREAPAAAAPDEHVH